MLRFRHTGQRIPEGKSGHRTPNYLDENWEILGSTAGQGYSSDVTFGGKGIYDEVAGIVYADDRWKWEWEPGDYSETFCWDDRFYSFREYTMEYGFAPSSVMDLIPPFPGTLNRLVGAIYTGKNSEHQYTRQPVIFYPSSQYDDVPWAYSSTISIPPFGSDWSIPDSRASYFPYNIHWLRSNLFFIACTFHQVYHAGSNPETSYWYPVYDSYILFQAPNKWRDLPDQVDSSNINFLKNSIWDWAYDGSCAEPDMQYAYVRRKSDGSIWKFRNWNPVTDEYTDFTNLPMVPTNPVQGVEYARFFMDGPPIPGNETWNNLMLLK